MTRHCLMFCSILLIVLPLTTPGQSGTLPHDGVDARADSSEFARQLSHVDPLVRQRAAEALAQLAAADQRKIVDGYQLQEQNKNVRLALNWALYRMGKTETLYRIVRDLDSSRHEQAVGYLKQLDGPSLIYPFLKQTDSPAKITVGLLEALSQLGDHETLDVLKPLQHSFTAGVAAAAEAAADKIATRLAQTETPASTRPRSVGTPTPDSP